MGVSTDVGEGFTPTRPCNATGHHTIPRAYRVEVVLVAKVRCGEVAYQLVSEQAVVNPRLGRPTYTTHACTIHDHNTGDSTQRETHQSQHQ